MNHVLHQQRVKSVYRMLLELANGNLGYRLEAEGDDAVFDDLVQQLNGVAKKIEQVDYLNPYVVLIVSDPDPEDIAVIVKKVQAYIFTHLEERVPTADTLAKLFGTNECTLKEGFRTLLQTSIYQYYNDERLKKAHHLIVHSVVPLKEIAYLCGFNAYTNFYKAFKKKYACTPIEVERLGR